MGKVIDDVTHRAFLEKIATGTALHLCDGEPVSRADVLTRSRVSYVLTPGLGNGDFTEEAGDVSGLQVRISQKDAGAPATAGPIDHVAIINATERLIVTTTPQATMTVGVPVSTLSWVAESQAPTP